ncbi:MAG: hypothetical protein ISS49_05180 [Anaerolineae bacterium]|nr:hypothetical protein [Anaerolineae bacterium]
MNTKFVIRGVLLALPVAVIATAVGLALMVRQTGIGPPPGPTPPPPTILAPRGVLPAGPAGFQEWVRYRGEPYGLAGSGFLILLSDGEIVGVTTAHSVSFGDFNRPLERIALRVAGQTDFVAEFDTLRGQPGRPRTGDDFTVDYVLLQPTQPLDPALGLIPDPRGAAQPGERVSLFSGLGDDHGGQRILDGTVQSVSDTAVWVLMDDTFNPSMMSGSPFVSQHTGQVVGMAGAASPRRNRLLLGAHPIGSIVYLAETAAEFQKMSQ